MSNHENLGLGVMIGMLSGNQDSAPAIADRIGKTISELKLTEDALSIGFNDGKKLMLSDNGQSCCEHRYLTGPDLSRFIGSEFQGASFKDEYSGYAQYEEREVQPVEILTSYGPFIVEHHNEHNGHYGGFWIQATLHELIDTPPPLN